MDAAAAVIGDLKQGVVAQLLVNGEGVELGLRGADVLIHVTQAGWRQSNGAGSGEWAGVGVGNGSAGAIDDDGIVGWVLDEVEGHVAEVALIRDAVAAT